MKLFTVAAAAALAAASIAAAQPVPAELSALATKARLGDVVAAWCRGQFRPGRPRAFAVAIAASAGGGRYAVLEMDATTVVCAFVAETTAECWQYSPGERAFVRVGGWVT